MKTKRFIENQEIITWSWWIPGTEVNLLKSIFRPPAREPRQ